MKGKLNGLYYIAPNVGKVRSRLENPSKDFTAKVREAYTEAVAEVLNESTIAIRAKMIARLSKIGAVAKGEKEASALSSVLNPFFDLQVATAPFREEEADADQEADEVPEAPETGAKDPDDFEN